MENDKDNLFEMMTRLLSGEKEDLSQWQQIGTLTPEEMRRKRNDEQRAHLAGIEIKLLEKKIQRIKLEFEEASDIWWRDLYVAHGLMEGTYQLTEDGKIMTKPKKKA